MQSGPLDPIIDFLVQNTWLLILVGIWLVSALGNLATRAARKAAEQQRREPRVQRPSAPAQAPPPPRPVREPRGPEPEEIAEQIRRMMGLEPETPPRPQRRVEPEPGRERPHVRVEVVDTEAPRERVTLTESHLASTIESELEHRHLESQLVDAGVRQRRLESRVELEEQRVRRRRRPMRSERVLRTQRLRRMDLSDPGAAIVLAEILGPPRALRDPDV